MMELIGVGLRSVMTVGSGVLRMKLIDTVNVGNGVDNVEWS
jgi:hypothetical protein